MGDEPAYSDFELLDRWAGGDLAAGNELFERHFDQVYRFFEHKARSDAADLVQRTFLACVEGHTRFRRTSSFRTYLYGIARNVLIMHFRERRDGLEHELGALADVGPSPSTLVGLRSEQRLLLEALRAIPMDLQIALELFYWEQISAAEVGEVLDLPEGTVRSRIRRGREALHEKLHELELSADKLASTLANLDAWAASLREGWVPGQRDPASSSNSAGLAPSSTTMVRATAQSSLPSSPPSRLPR